MVHVEPTYLYMHRIDERQLYRGQHYRPIVVADGCLVITIEQPVAAAPDSSGHVSPPSLERSPSMQATDWLQYTWRSVGLA
jgi:hypothetical protein